MNDSLFLFFIPPGEDFRGCKAQPPFSNHERVERQMKSTALVLLTLTSYLLSDKKKKTLADMSAAVWALPKLKICMTAESIHSPSSSIEVESANMHG